MGVYTMIIDYKLEIKTQKNNGFCIFKNSDKHLLTKALEDRLLFLCQLGPSRQDIDKQVYNLLVIDNNKKDFGTSPKYDYASNTGIAALAGAIEKLHKGDISQKQMSQISIILEVMSAVYNKKFSNIQFRLVEDFGSVKDSKFNLFYDQK